MTVEEETEGALAGVAEDAIIESTTEGKPFTVGELIEELQVLNPNILVVLSKDEDGSSFAPMTDIGYSKFVGDDSGTGYLIEEDLEDDPGANNLPGEYCVVLWPGA